MALTSAQQTRGQGASQRVTDADGRDVTLDAGGIADTAVACGGVTSPGATATLASIAGLVAGGVYRVRVVLSLSGTAETATTNALLRTNGAAATGGGGSARMATIAGASVTVDVPRLTCGANGVIDVATVAAATAGAIYTTLLTATRVE